MGSSAKKKREKKQDFQKPKLKVGKARPKNTNATDTTFSAKSITLKQQNLSETSRDSLAHFDHNLSLLSSRNDTQRRDALTFLVGTIVASKSVPPRPVSAILVKCQPLILDGSSTVRQQLLKLLKVLPPNQLGAVDQILLYTRAGMTHLSADIRSTSLDVLDWLLETNGESVVACAGGWVRLLMTFQTLLAWNEGLSQDQSTADGKWSTSKSFNTSAGGTRLLVHQLGTLARFLVAGMRPLPSDVNAGMRRAAELFPLWQSDAHLLPRRSNAYGYLNLFGAPRAAENEVYDQAAERCEVFHDLNLFGAFTRGVQKARGMGGEVGRAAALVEKALNLADEDRRA